MKRTALLILLLAAYLGLFGRRLVTGSAEGFDALGPQGREVERALADKRFDQALPIASELQTFHPDEPLIALWLAETYNGLQRFADEAAAWERFISTGSEPAEACPRIAEAYARIDDGEQGLPAYERCAKLDPNEPERLIDLGDALARAGKLSEALGAYHQAATLNPRHPVVVKRIERLAPTMAGGGK